MSKPVQRVVIVSSSKQEAQFWDMLLPELERFPGLSGAYQFHHLLVHSLLSTYENRNILSRLFQHHNRQIELLSKALQRYPFLDSHLDLDPELQLIGFGPACRLIQGFLLRRLTEDDNVRRIRRIQQAIFLTPRRSNWISWAFGVLFLTAILATLLYILWPSQALLVGVASAVIGLFSIATAAFAIATSPLALTVLGLESEWFLGAQIQREFTEKIKHGNRRKSGTWPIPSQEIWPSKVRKGDTRITQELAEAILEPDGHPNVYEVDLFEYTITISPIHANDLPQGARDKLVMKRQFTSKANLVSHVRFAGKDQTSKPQAHRTAGELIPWELRQRTGGYLEVHDPASDNLATSEENFAKHSGYIYRFRPKAYEDHFLRVALYGAYEAGNRDNHFHLRADANFRLIRGNLDLSGYLQAGWQIREPKALFFNSAIPSMHASEHPESLERLLKDLQCDCLANKRVLGLELIVQQPSPGVFTWEKPLVGNGGIIAFEFDVVEPEGLE